MRKEGNLGVIVLLSFACMVLVLSMPLVSAGLLSDIADWFRDLFNIRIGEEVKGRVGELYSVGGDGISITNCQELQNMKNDLTADYILTKDINCYETRNWNSGKGFEPVGSRTYPFKGSLSGQGHKITDLYISRFYQDNIGLFGVVDTDATKKVEKVGLERFYIYGKSYVGSLAGDLINGVVDGVYGKYITAYGYGVYIGGLVGSNNGTVTYSNTSGSVNGKTTVGGLVGWNREIITHSYSSCSVKGGTSGGLVGFNSKTITNSYASGSVREGTSGGLVGSNNGEIIDCYATGYVSGSIWLGGLVGMNTKTITNCYASGGVSGSSRVGGLAGQNSDVITNCFSTGSVSGSSSLGGLVGLNRLTITNCYWNNHAGNPDDCYSGGNEGCTAKQNDKAYFYSKDNPPMTSWDFVNIWKERTSNYPIFGFSCTSKTCEDLGKDCGNWSDGCGDIINCGSCGNGTCYNGECRQKCTDSDGGRNYYEKGTTIGYIDDQLYTREDKCWILSNVTFLSEYYCISDYELMSYPKRCAYGCEDGACLECLNNSNCEDGKVCENGRCVEEGVECVNDSDCEIGEICLNGTCVEDVSRITLNVSETKSVNIEGEYYNVSLIAISAAANPQASISVNGESKTFTQGQTYSVGGLIVFAETIFRSGENQGYVILQLEADQTIKKTDRCDYLGEEIKSEMAYLQNEGESLILEEGLAIKDDEYFVLSNNYDSHLMKMTKIDLNQYGSDVFFRDVITGEDYRLIDNDFNINQTPGTSTDFALDGITHIVTTVTLDSVKITWHPEDEIYTFYCDIVEPTCVDSDGGKNIYEKGIVTWDNQTSQDYCLVAGGTYRYVTEFFCENNTGKSEVFECPDGYSCQDGACAVEGELDVFIVYPESRTYNTDVSELRYIIGYRETKDQLSNVFSDFFKFVTNLFNRFFNMGGRVIADIENPLEIKTAKKGGKWVTSFVEISVQNIGKEDISSIKFIFENDDGESYVIEKPVEIKEFETRDFKINYGLDIENPTEVSVIPIFKNIDLEAISDSEKLQQIPEKSGEVFDLFGIGSLMDASSDYIIEENIGELIFLESFEDKEVILEGNPITEGYVGFYSDYFSALVQIYENNVEEGQIVGFLESVSEWEYQKGEFEGHYLYVAYGEDKIWAFWNNRNKLIVVGNARMQEGNYSGGKIENLALAYLNKYPSELRGCQDSDITAQYPDGRNYYTKGTACNDSSCEDDKCYYTLTEKLKENYCSGEDVVNELVTCEEGCEYGACLGGPVGEDFCWYSIDNGKTNSSAVSVGTNFTGIISVEGNNTWTVWCIVNGSEMSDSVTFIKETGGEPRINIDVLNPDLTKTKTLEAEQNEFFPVILRVTCYDGDCGDVEVSLDPSGGGGGSSGSTLNYKIIFEDEAPVSDIAHAIDLSNTIAAEKSILMPVLKNLEVRKSDLKNVSAFIYLNRFIVITQPNPSSSDLELANYIKVVIENKSLVSKIITTDDVISDNLVETLEKEFGRVEKVDRCDYLSEEIKSAIREIKNELGETIVLEEELAIKDDEYFVLSNNYDSKLMKMTKIDLNQYGSDVHFRDVINGLLYTLIDNDPDINQTPGTSTTFALDGTTHTVTTVTPDSVKITWAPENEIYTFYCDEGEKSGLIPENPNAKPFYTNNSNPRTIYLNEGDSETVVFWVNATGSLTGSTSSSDVTVNVSEIVTVEFGGKSYEVSLAGISEGTYPLVSIVVNGESKTFKEGETREVAGVDVFVKTVFRTGENEGWVILRLVSEGYEFFAYANLTSNPDISYITEKWNVKIIEALCIPQTCLILGKECGYWGDGCGGTLYCGDCQTGKICDNGICVIGQGVLDGTIEIATKLKYYREGEWIELT